MLRYMVAKDMGYIRLSRFGVTSGEEFKKAESELKAQGMKHLILDLTDNGGGILQVANEIADEFLGDGTDSSFIPKVKTNPASR
jgi:carboxyl-terminal processing protease